MTLSDRIGSLFAAHLPMRCSHFQISLVEEGARVGQGFIAVCVQVVTYTSSEPPMLADVQQQDMPFGRSAAHPEARWLAYLEGTLRALPALVEQHAAYFDRLMPMDLLLYPEALHDVSLVTADDFARALEAPARVSAWEGARSREEWVDEMADEMEETNETNERMIPLLTGDAQAQQVAGAWIDPSLQGPALAAVIEALPLDDFENDRDLPALREALYAHEAAYGVTSAHIAATARLRPQARLGHSHGHDREIEWSVLSPDGASSPPARRSAKPRTARCSYGTCAPGDA